MRDLIKRLKYYLRYILISDEKYIKYKFKKRFDYELNISNPKTINEKIQWLKLFDRTPLHTKCADKYLVREYIKEIMKSNEENKLAIFIGSGISKCIEHTEEMPPNWTELMEKIKEYILSRTS